MKNNIFISFILVDVLLILVFVFDIGKPSLTPLAAAQRISAICLKNDQYQDCLGEEFASLVEPYGFSFMKDALRHFQNIDVSTRNCHVIGHKITQKLTNRDPERWLEILDQIDPSGCGGGFMHGVLEVKTGIDTDFEITRATFEEICKKSYSNGPDTSCAHILGHLTLFQKEGNLESALEVCTGLSGNYLFECYGGIFMEDSFRTNFVDHGLEAPPIRNKDWFLKQLARCKKYNTLEYVEAGCFYDLAEVAAQVNDYVAKGAYEVCLNQTRWPQSKERCYVRASYIVATAPIPKIDNMDFSELCGLFPENGKVEQKCINETVGALMSYSLNFIDRANAFCKTRDANNREMCFSRIRGEIVSEISLPEEREQFCLRLPAPYRRNCSMPLETP